MNRMTPVEGFQHATARCLLGLSLLALLVISSLGAQAAPAALAAAHLPGGRLPNQDAPRHHVQAPPRPSRPPGHPHSRGKGKPQNGGSLKWQYPTGGPVTSTPTVVNGVVYVGSYDHSVYALDASSGAVVWSYPTGGNVSSSPAVANGVVYVGSQDDSIYALNASSGALLWSYPTGGQVWSSPTVANGVLYVGSDDHSVYALNASSGAQLWSYQTGAQVQSRPTVVNGVLYVGSFDHSVYALNASSGTSLWSYQTGGPIVYSSPTVVNGVLYVGSQDDYVYALNASDGTLLWRYLTGNWIWSSPMVVNGVLYVGSFDNYVYALNASNGTLLWRYLMGGGGESSPAVVNGVVYIGNGDFYVYALNASNGTLLWRYLTGGNVYSSPTVANGVVFVGSDDTYVYALTSYSPGGAPQLEVVGNQLVDKNTGQAIVLHGVHRDNAQYGCINPSAQNQQYRVFPDIPGPSASEVAAMQTNWHINAVRIPLNEQCWLGTAELPFGAIGGTAYQNAIKGYVSLLNQAGLVAILDLDYSAPAGELASGYNSMPDKDYSLLFWQSVAQAFAGNDAVVFDAFNQPTPPNYNHFDATTWTCWLKGQTYNGDTSNSCAGGCPDYYTLKSGDNTLFDCVGMQQVVQTIRTATLPAPDNVIMLAGAASGTEFNLWNQFLPQDPTTGQAYTNLAIGAQFHINVGDDQSGLVQQIQNGYPVIAGVVGENDSPTLLGYTGDGYLLQTLAFLDNPKGDGSLPPQSYMGWRWAVNNDGTDLITDYVPGDPSTCFGQAYQAHLLGNAPPTCP